MGYKLSLTKSNRLNRSGLLLVIIFVSIISGGCLSSEPNTPEEAVNMYYTYIDEGKFDRAADLLFAIRKGDMGYDYPQPLLPADREQIIRTFETEYGDGGENINISTVITRIKRSEETSIAGDGRVITEIQRAGFEIYTIQTTIIGTLNGQNVTLARDHNVAEMGNWRIIIG